MALSSTSMVSRSLAAQIAKQDFARVHLFEIKGRKLCLDVNSARVVRLSDEAFEVLRAFQCKEVPATMPVVAVNEIVGRIEAGSLFTEPLPYDPSLHPLPLIESAILNLTHNCNLGCEYCFMEFPDVRDHYGGSKKRMADETAFASIDFLRSRSRPGMTVTFFGGEPLLEFGLLRRVIEYAEERHPGWFSWNVITNGTRLVEEVRTFLDSHAVSVIVSIDGTKETHDRLRPYKKGQGSYDDIMANVSKMTRRRAGLKVNVTYASPTTDLRESYVELRRQGVKSLRMEKAAVPPGDRLTIQTYQLGQIHAELGEIAASYRDELINGEATRVDNFVDVVYRTNAGEPRRRGCDTGLGYVAIASDGTIYPCHKFVGDPRFNLGTVFDDFDTTFGQQIWDRPVETRSVCDTCWARTICGGYCVADNFLRSGGDFFTPDRRTCDIIRATIEQGVWLHEELLEDAPAALREMLSWKFVLPEDRPLQNSSVVVVDRDPLTLELAETRYELNSVCAQVWSACDGRHDMAALCEILGNEYPDLDGRLLADDLRHALSKLVGTGLVTTEASSSAVQRHRATLKVLNQGCTGCDCK